MAQLLQHLDGGAQVALHLFAVEDVFHRYQSQCDFRGDVPDLVRAETVADVHQLEDERQADAVVVFRIVREHGSHVQVPAFPAVVEDKTMATVGIFLWFLTIM